MMNLTDQAKPLTHKLPSNYVIICWERMNKRFSKSFIQKVATAKRRNFDINKTLLEIAKEHQQALSDLENEISSLS